MYEYQLIPVSRLIEHLGDKGLFDQAAADELQSAATRLSVEGFQEPIIIQAIFNMARPEVLEEIKRFRESPDEHRELNHIRLLKVDLFKDLIGKLNGEQADIEAAFQQVSGAIELTLAQALYYIPHHHPKAIDAIVGTYLAIARQQINSTSK